MNFFEHQHQARKHSKRLVVLFLLAVVAIIAAIDLVFLIVLSTTPGDDGAQIGLARAVQQHGGFLVFVAVAVSAIIGIASMVRISGLREGGAAVARSLGATLVSPDTNNPHYRRLRNVVEEIAIASGVPVPQIYVMEQEEGINAFAAGFNATDAAVAVTRGALERLRRDELQGVIAHEFSHILNGDMRLNIRLMGVLFGILVIGIIGRKILEQGRHIDGKGALPLFAVALAVMVIGYVGLFFGRWIKAGVSRSREYLADASAVQFTRQTEGLANALKKVGGLPSGSRIENPEVEEVSHMLFGSGMSFSSMFATHPPLLDRIQRLDRHFKPEQFRDIARTLAATKDVLALDAELGLDRVAGLSQRPSRAAPPPLPPADSELAVRPSVVAAQVGQPAADDYATADAIQNRIPPILLEAARSQNGCRSVLFALLLDGDASIRARQLAMVAAHGADVAARTTALHEAMEALHPMQRMPLAAIAFPSLRRQTRHSLDEFLALARDLIAADGQTGLFEYCLERLIRLQVIDSLDPPRAGALGTRKLVQCEAEVLLVFAVLARHGHDDAASATRAFQAGMARLFPGRTLVMPAAVDWHEGLARSLGVLDRLNASGKQLLIEALVVAISHDGRISVAESELLRVICAGLHCPLPPTLAR